MRRAARSSRTGRRVVVLRATRAWRSLGVVAPGALVVAAAVALGAHAAWPALPAGAQALAVVLAAVAGGALGAAQRSRRSRAARSSGNLLARQLAVSAREAEASRFRQFA